ncbi:hypothetical protein EAS64_33880 [Trebonia kvetii]|uniref:Uncharacterized protein n=1 Tax=Trebonia kvetii TaxID=2480626 RepID=A0A6P2BS71_9ACTN|nr:hypothetical protein [Trebonia kvetii]TVZ01271.1 hypothetical protein EAS64_33880 [Trebonia kvetii]
MPAFKFADFGDRIYAFVQNLEGEFIGHVEPGDIHNFEAAPDHRWIPIENGPESNAEAPSLAPAANETPVTLEPSPAVSAPSPVPVQTGFNPYTQPAIVH